MYEIPDNIPSVLSIRNNWPMEVWTGSALHRLQNDRSAESGRKLSALTAPVTTTAGDKGLMYLHWLLIWHLLSFSCICGCCSSSSKLIIGSKITSAKCRPIIMCYCTVAPKHPSDCSNFCLYHLNETQHDLTPASCENTSKKWKKMQMVCWAEGII